mgnify:CR=1 FL=1
MDLAQELERRRVLLNVKWSLSTSSLEWNVVDEMLKGFGTLIILEKSFDKNSISFDPIIPTMKYKIAMDQLRRELETHCKKSTTDLTPDNIIDMIKCALNSYNRNTKDRFSLRTKNKGNVVQFTVAKGKGKKRELVGSMRKDLYNKLKKQYINSGFNKNLCNKRIAILWIRYLSLNNGRADGLQWNVTSDFMNILKRKLKVDMELFASPINVYPGNRFCSLFYDVDKYFGSLGDFIKNIDGITGVFEANPPFIEIIQNTYVDRLIARMELNDDPLCAITVMADWKDSVGHISACNSRYTRYMRSGPMKFRSEIKNRNFTDLKFNVFLFVMMNDKMYEKQGDLIVNTIEDAVSSI